MWGVIYGWMRRQVGQRSDTADAAGSVHAKIVELRAYLAGTYLTALTNLITARQKPRYFVMGSYTTSSTSYVTALSVTGAGKLNVLKLTTTDSTPSYEIYVNGSKVLAGRKSSGSGATWYPDLNFLLTNSDGTDTLSSTGVYDNMAGGISFSTSFEIKVKVGSGSLTAYWAYEREAA